MLKILAIIIVSLVLASCSSIGKPITKNIETAVEPSIERTIGVGSPSKINEKNLPDLPEKNDSNALIMAILTGLLVLVGFAQVMMLVNQKRQNQLGRVIN